MGVINKSDVKTIYLNKSVRNRILIFGVFILTLFNMSAYFILIALNNSEHSNCCSTMRKRHRWGVLTLTEASSSVFDHFGAEGQPRSKGGLLGTRDTALGVKYSASERLLPLIRGE